MMKDGNVSPRKQKYTQIQTAASNRRCMSMPSQKYASEEDLMCAKCLRTENL